MSGERSEIEATPLEIPADLAEHIEKSDEASGSGGGEAQAREQPTQVPHAALAEARENERRLRAEIQASNERYARLNGRLDQLFQQPQQPQYQEPAAKPDPEPDKEKDIAGWLEWKARETDKALQYVAARDQEVAWQRHYQEQAQAETQALGAHIAPHVMAFRSAVPDYDQAAQHAQAVVYQASLQQGAPPQQAAQQTQNLITQTARIALAWGVNPAEMMYRLAGAVGYRPPQQQLMPEGQQTAQQTQQQAGNGRDEQGRFVPKEPPKSLGSMTGQAGGRVSLNDLDRMSDSEFDNYMNKGKGLRRMHGL